MNQALARAQKPDQAKPELRVVQPPARTLESVLAEGRGRPCAFKEWSALVDRQAKDLKEKDPKMKKRSLEECRQEVLAQDRSCWM